MARDLRQIFDPPELCESIAAASNADRKKYLGESIVRRGEQGRNAHEPDIMVEGCPWWFEAEDGGSKGPLKKHRQARKDLELHQLRGGSTWYKSVAICHPKRAQHSTATLTLLDLWATVRGEPVSSCASNPPPFHDLPVTIDYQDFLDLLRTEHERNTAESTS